MLFQSNTGTTQMFKFKEAHSQVCNNKWLIFLLLTLSFAPFAYDFYIGARKEPPASVNHPILRELPHHYPPAPTNAPPTYPLPKENAEESDTAPAPPYPQR